MERMRGPILRALRDAGLRAESVDEVLLVGGATRMPCVARLAAQLFGRLPLRKLPPDEAVALGAGVQAALKSGDTAVSDVVVTDVAPFTMGIATTSGFGANAVAGIFAPILERGTVIPTSRVKSFTTVAHGQTRIQIDVFQGEHSMCTSNTLLGQYTVSGIPPAVPGAQAIDVRFTYDLNGLLEVEATVSATGKKEVLVIEAVPGRLDKAQVQKAREAMQRLKLDPRDALPNTTAIARAEALFVELTGDLRTELGTAIAAFRSALESQAPEQIEPTRQMLIAMTAELRRGRP